LWKAPRYYFGLQNSHGHAKAFLRNLQSIRALALKTVRQPWPRHMPNVREEIYVKYRVVSKWVQTRRPAATNFHSNTLYYVEPFVTSWQSLATQKKKRSAPLRNAKIHNRVNNSMALDPIVKPVRIPTSYFNIIPLNDRLTQMVSSRKAFGPTRCTALHLDTTEYELLTEGSPCSDYSSIQLIPFFRVQIFCTTPCLKQYHHGLLTTQNNRQTFVSGHVDLKNVWSFTPFPTTSL
jgi:hypothetical protein